ncbi:MAG: hypothetical protein ACLQLG_08520 [Thermoguttaceae bacterium]
MMSGYNLGATFLFIVSIVFACANTAHDPHPGPATQLGLASCGFAIAGGLALVAGALQKNRGTSKKDE